LKQLLRLFYQEPNASFSILNISRQLKISYSYVYREVNSLAERKILRKKKLGPAIFCSLNHENTSLLNYFAEIAYGDVQAFFKNQQKLSRPVQELIDRLPERTNFNLLSIVLFGSYAKESAVTRSDLDLLFIVISKDPYREIIESENLSLSRRYRITVNPVLVEPAEFIKMIQVKEINLAHEAVKYKVILYGREKFWELVFKGIRS